MATIHKLSEQMIDMAERLDNVADAAKGKGPRRSGVRSRWLLLPAAGAGLYALATSNAFSRQAKEVMGQAKERASELPDDLMSRIRQTTQKSTTGNGGQRRRTSSSRKSSTARKTAGSSR
ncbi:MAG TPA: hypothetical protein VK915_10115 [Gaiellaceae bacterium]|nr:hypothetical protein [Gaiellaceae bacterium]